jgi:import inner membrane translocase subunit TIM16
MAHRLLAQVVVTGARVFGRAFTEAYKEAAAATTAQQAQKGSGKDTKKTNSASRDGDFSLGEACKILDVDLSGLTLDKAQKKYDYLFDINSKEKGGSFYIQSKVYRSMERIKNELQYLEEYQKAKEGKTEETNTSQNSKDSSSDNKTT